ncbi:hypothetical protein TNCV_399021 [Trichonephila clavipes]|uniref:Uncharacterized protein n=1 Tax=Trichonephila clavipes TaxID=2585209 RepID=A0A8X7B7K6_TRICX|nr:hypothetical protein TNCV_399021 [Trichonephila clavipes]
MSETTQLGSRNETTQLVSRNETTQLVSRNETTQLCTAVDRLQPPTTAYNRLQPPTTACNRLQPPTTAYNRLQPPATACNRLQPPAPPAPPLQQNRLFYLLSLTLNYLILKLNCLFFSLFKLSRFIHCCEIKLLVEPPSNSALTSCISPKESLMKQIAVKSKTNFDFTQLVAVNRSTP